MGQDATTGRPPGRMDAIDGLRGLAVIAVVYFHAGIWGESLHLVPPLRLGRAGVDLFLVLSGFCLFWPLVRGGRVSALALRPYAVRRATRICPPYYAALALVLAVSALVSACGVGQWWANGTPAQTFLPWRGADSALDLLSHALLLHGLSNDYARSFDGAFWSLSLEWQFYAALPLLVWVARRHSVPAAVAITVVVAAGYRLALKAVNPALLHTPLGDDLFVSRWAQFGAGMLAAAIVAGAVGGRCAALAWRWPSVATCVVIAVGLEYCGRGKVVHPFAWAAAFGLLTLHATRSGAFQRTLQWRPLVWVGTRSYSLYLVHGATFMAMSVLISRWAVPSEWRQAVYLTLGPVMALAVAVPFFQLFERPFLYARRPAEAVPPDRPTVAAQAVA